MQSKADEILEFLRKIKESNKPVIVEGKKDALALRKFQITNTIELSKKPLFQVIEHIAYNHKDCIILTDLDKEGRKLFSRLNSGLQKFGVRVDNKFREFLFKHTKLRQIEGLATYIENNQ